MVIKKIFFECEECHTRFADKDFAKIHEKECKERAEKELYQC